MKGRSTWLASRDPHLYQTNVSAAIHHYNSPAFGANPTAIVQALIAPINYQGWSLIGLTPKRIRAVRFVPIEARPPGLLHEVSSQSTRPNAGHQCTRPSPVEILRAQVCSNDELSFVMEAHDALSATISQRSGFKGLWASGSSIAGSLGYRDANEASWTQLVESLQRIVDSTALAVSLTATGFGQLQRCAPPRTQTLSGSRGARLA